eukprot:14927223-Heterocapsa_arctica.AAC.1
MALQPTAMPFPGDLGTAHPPIARVMRDPCLAWLQWQRVRYLPTLAGWKAMAPVWCAPRRGLLLRPLSGRAGFPVVAPVEARQWPIRPLPSPCAFSAQ